MNFEKYINKVDNFPKRLLPSNNLQIINFEIIESWLEIFRPFALDKLKESDELIVFIPRGKGLELLSALKDIVDEDFEEYHRDGNVLFVASVKKGDLLYPIYALKSETIKTKCSLSYYLEQNDGVIRVNDA